MQKEKSKQQTTKSFSVACPFCGSLQTRRETDFGTALAYAQFYCRACRTPFECIKWDDRATNPDLPSFLAPEKNAKF